MMYGNNLIIKLPQNTWLISIADRWSSRLQAIADAAGFELSSASAVLIYFLIECTTCEGKKDMNLFGSR